ncbi:MAG: aldehyde ferredoxin oxidoreductase family protein [Chloroflexi bacterium]|nr:aldehyde ferredoxin oxidoreductase family protein [Chloroflexota bacterium]
MYGHTGRVGFINLTTGEMRERKLDEGLARTFIGGYGLGARILFEQQGAGVEALGPENTLGFCTGPLTGTPVPTGGRFTVVCKSPLTGGWGDANCGGHFGSELKQAGWDALFFTGTASAPKYLLVTDDRTELRDAALLWGKDAIETEETLITELGDPGTRVACIGMAAEKLSLISGVCTDKGRIAARSGVGAVMGAKRLKAIAVRGHKKVPVADRARLNQLRREFAAAMREAAFGQSLQEYGTCGHIQNLIAGGATPVKNWLYAGSQAFPTMTKLDADKIIGYQVKKFACSNCPIACGGILKVPGGDYPLAETHKPEYETLAALGSLCLIDDLHALLKMNDLCNRGGLDTISAGTVIAFAMECYEHGIITRDDTGGLNLTWGNTKATLVLLERMVRREGLGDVLADGVKMAASKIGRGAAQYAMHVGGQEPGMHNALFWPGRGTGYVVDPTPGRHTTAGPMTRVDMNIPVAPYPEVQFTGFERYEYKGKGPAAARASSYWQVGACSGLCLFPVVYFGNFPMLDFLNAVTGWQMDMAELLQTGRRIQTLRQLFNIREGIDPSRMTLPGRLSGIPPKTEGPLQGITIDIDTLAKDYRKGMGWDPDTGRPTNTTIAELGLADFAQEGE